MYEVIITFYRNYHENEEQCQARFIVAQENDNMLSAITKAYAEFTRQHEFVFFESITVKPFIATMLP